MIYKYTEDNIISILQSVGTLEEAQLVRYFSDELQPSRVKYLLNQLVLDRTIKYDENTKCYSAVGAAEVVDEIRDRDILAFWVIANMGSNGVDQVVLTRYPTQYLVMGHDFRCYDITVVESEMEARAAARIIAESIPRGQEDHVIHLAVLRRPTDVQRLRSVLLETGFDSCVTIDFATKVPSYTQLGVG